MTSKDVSKLFPIGAGQATPEKLADAADAMQVLWAYLMTGLSDLGEDGIDPRLISNISPPLAAAAQMASTTFTTLSWIAGTYGSRPDLYEHEEGPLNECTDLAATLLRQASEQQRALSNTIDDIGRFTSCVRTRTPKNEAAQQDS